MAINYPNLTTQVNNIESNTINLKNKIIDVQNTCSKNFIESENNTKNIDYLMGLIQNNVSIGYIFSGKVKVKY